MRIVGQSFPRARIWIGAACVYSVAAFAAALEGGRAPDDPAASVVPFCAAFAVGFIPWGRWADRHGAARAMRASTILLALAGLLLLVPAGDEGWLAARALEGFAAAGFPPAAQAALAALGGAKGAGRAIGGMSVAVAVGTLAIPLLVGALEPVLGTTAMIAFGAVLLPLLGLGAVAKGSDPNRNKSAIPSQKGSDPNRDKLAITSQKGSDPLRLGAGLVSAWVCAFFVLIAYWTVVTRVAELLGPGGAGMSETAARAVPLVGGIAGMVLTGIVAGLGDRLGPRRPMAAVLATGTAGLVLAASSGAVAAAAAGVALFSLSYWCYLTLVGLQVVRSAPAAAHGRALGGLYSAMWLGAAVGGLLAATGANWTAVLGACAIAWALAAVVAARWFEDSGNIGRRWLPLRAEPATSTTTR